MKLKGFLRPCTDEVFTSWILRCALSGQCRSVWLSDIEDYSYSCNVLGEDQEFGFGRSFETLCASAGINAKWCRIFFAAKFEGVILEPWSRNSFCANCLNEDVVKLGFPCWRKIWCSYDSAYCSVHKVLLQRFNANDYKLKAWDAFVEANEYVGIKEDLDSYIRPMLNKYLMRDRLGLRMQNWVLRNRLRANGGSLCDVIDLLLMSFLSLRTEWREPGFARVLFKPYCQIPITHQDYNYSMCMMSGARTSSPIQRMSALLLLGVVLEVFSNDELNYLRAHAQSAGYNFPVTSREVGIYMPSFLSMEERAWYSSLLLAQSKNCSNDVIKRIEDFLSTIRAES